MAMLIARTSLADIVRRDPDGGETKPTERDYENFDSYVISTYGEHVLKAYLNGKLKEL